MYHHTFLPWLSINAYLAHPNTVKGLSDVSENYHDYTVGPLAILILRISLNLKYKIDWKPDALTFYVDGQAQGSVKASDYLNNSVSQYPNTPSRVQFSLWPAGISSSASGTVQWAGGGSLYTSNCFRLSQ